MNYREAKSSIQELRIQISGLREQLRAVQASAEPEEVPDYELAGSDGPVRLAELFGEKDTLIVIHNMGAGCVYCTMWADGFNGIRRHLEDRAAFVVSSPDAPEAQRKFAASRGWGFRMVSHAGTSFAADMGYHAEDGFRPGVSVFRRKGDRIVRLSDTSLGPWDDFCSVWHFFALLPEGVAGWQPKYRYGT